MSKDSDSLNVQSRNEPLERKSAQQKAIVSKIHEKGFVTFPDAWFAYGESKYWKDILSETIKEPLPEKELLQYIMKIPRTAVYRSLRKLVKNAEIARVKNIDGVWIEFEVENGTAIPKRNEEGKFVKPVQKLLDKQGYIVLSCAGLLHVYPPEMRKKISQKIEFERANKRMNRSWQKEIKQK